MLMIRTLRDTALLGLAVSLVLPWLAAVPAAAQPAQAQQFIERRHAAVHRVLRADASTASARTRRDAQLDRMLSELLDYDTLSQRSLAKHWEDRSPSERKDFVALLQQLVERSYKRNLENTLGYSVRYTGAEAQDEGVLVQTVARSKKNPRAPAVSIDYRLHKVDGQWRVYDVITDGVSMVRNYRNQFNRIISKDGWSGLLERMRSKLASEDAF
jgi:phospholipid transport system substrate-binding protein